MSRRSTGPATIKLVLETHPASTVARPGNYLSAINPAFTEGGVPQTKKAKL